MSSSPGLRRSAGLHSGLATTTKNPRLASAPHTSSASAGTVVFGRDISRWSLPPSVNFAPCLSTSPSRPLLNSRTNPVLILRGPAFSASRFTFLPTSRKDSGGSVRPATQSGVTTSVCTPSRVAARHISTDSWNVSGPQPVPSNMWERMSIMVVILCKPLREASPGKRLKRHLGRPRRGCSSESGSCGSNSSRARVGSRCSG